MSLLPLQTYSQTHVWSTIKKNIPLPKWSAKTKGEKCFLETIVLHDLKAMEKSCKNEREVRRLQNWIDLPHMHVSKDECFLIEHCKQFVPTEKFASLDFPEAEQKNSLKILIDNLPEAYAGMELYTDN